MSNHLEVWVDTELCTGCGKCVDIAPEVFELDDRYSLSQIKKAGMVTVGSETIIVPERLEESVIEAAEQCPGSIIYIDIK